MTRQIEPLSTLSPASLPPEASQPKIFSQIPRPWQSLLWGLALSTTAVTTTLAGIGAAWFIPWVPQTGSSAPSATTVGQAGPLPYQLTRPVNILVMGIDRVEDAPPQSPEAFAGRSDTILLLRFDPQQSSLKVLSIPRDTRVSIPRVGYSKINNANIYGGAELAAQVISQNLQEVPIDRYVRVTTNAFRELVDLVGGVEVYVPTPMVYQDVTQKLTINLEAGEQVLNGDQAEQFARFRKDGKGDIGRVQRQEVLLKALQQRFTSPLVIPRIPQAIQVLQQSVDTNLTPEEVLALVNFAYQLKREQVQMVMLPGRFSQPTEFDGLSYWLFSESGRDRVMEQYFGLSSQTATSPTQASPQRLSIAIQNATDDPALAEALQTHLRQQHFRNVYISTDAPQLLAETEIIAQQGDLQSAKLIQQYLGGGKVEASSTGILGSDITLRLGLDAPRLLAQPATVQP
ncbi:LCP family protein [Synechocystis sp. LKSZ1]|uniref:LCP family protein n=1 Tax=Synechocystis sp. LKSZ1 TaxID=3144951 RepID=UPI00336C1152